VQGGGRSIEVFKEEEDKPGRSVKHEEEDDRAFSKGKKVTPSRFSEAPPPL